MAWTLFGRNWLTGIICMWSGLIVDIPNGWALCDGTNGTPDLRSRFVQGAPIGWEAGGTGGASTHRHTVSGNTGLAGQDHDHHIAGNTEEPQAGYEDYADVGGAIADYTDHMHDIDFTSGFADDDHKHTFWAFSGYYPNNPLYYNILFIMKL